MFNDENTGRKMKSLSFIVRPASNLLPLCRKLSATQVLFKVCFEVYP